MEGVHTLAIPLEERGDGIADIRVCKMHYSSYILIALLQRVDLPFSNVDCNSLKQSRYFTLMSV